MRARRHSTILAATGAMSARGARGATGARGARGATSSISVISAMSAAIVCMLALVLLSGCGKVEYVTNKSIELSLAVYGSSEPQDFSGIYTGEVIDEMPNGDGVFESTSKDGVYWSYEGSWSNGHMEGEGIYIWSSADTYVETGTYHADLFTQGTITTSDFVYEGSVGENGYYTGSGTLSFTSGENAGAWYEGTFKNGGYNGQGVFHFADGRYYAGSFVDDAFCGEGTLHNTDGSWFSGTWADGQLNGQGKYYDKDGNLVEAGIYEDGVLQKNVAGALATQKSSTSSNTSSSTSSNTSSSASSNTSSSVASNTSSSSSPRTS